MRLCGGVSAVHLMKLTACTIISKPQNTGLLVNQKASYRRKQTQQASRRAAGAERRDGLATQQVAARRRRSSVGLRCRRGTRSAFGAGGAPSSRQVRMPSCGAWFAAGASGTLEHERRDEAVGVRRRRGARLSGLAARAKPQDAPVFYSASVFGAPILPFAMLMPRLPIFWALLQKNGPKFDVTPELLGGFRGTILCRIILTWGNICARGCVSPFPLAKPPRSSGGPITVVWLSRLLRYRFCASPRCGRGHVSFVSPGRRPRGFSARAPRAGFFRPASPFLARLYPFESAVHRVVVFVRVRRSMPWLVHLARPPS